MDGTDPGVVLSQVSDAIRAKAPSISVADIESILGDLRVNTTIKGASTLELDLIDPEWVLLTSGFLDCGSDGKLDAVDLNYPLGSDYWWRLTMCDASIDKSIANITLTFETRIVAQERDIKGPKFVKTWSRAQFTRAQAIKAMLAHVRADFISPELDIHQTPQVP